MTALVELRIGDRGPRGAPVVGASPGTRDAPGPPDYKRRRWKRRHRHNRHLRDLLTRPQRLTLLGLVLLWGLATAWAIGWWLTSASVC